MTSQTRETPDVDATMAVFDLDGTITRHDTYIPFLLGFLARKPLRILRCGLLPFHALVHLLGLRGNSWLKLKFLSQCCGGASRQALADYGADFAARIVRKGLLPDAVAAIEFHRARGDRLMLISASFDLYVDEIGKLLFDHIIASKAAWPRRSWRDTDRQVRRRELWRHKVTRLKPGYLANGKDRLGSSLTGSRNDLPCWGPIPPMWSIKNGMRNLQKEEALRS